jgi:hypothetical protein
MVAWLNFFAPANSTLLPFSLVFRITMADGDE